MTERINTLDMIEGFKFYEAYVSTATDNSTGEESDVYFFKFVNDRHVMVEVMLLEGDFSIEEIYAVDNEFKPIDK